MRTFALQSSLATPPMDNKAFVTHLAQRMACDTSCAGRMLDSFASLLGEQCGRGNKVAIPGFGTFEGIKHNEEITTDLTTGKRLLLPPSIELRFIAGGMMKKHLKNGRK